MSTSQNFQHSEAKLSPEFASKSSEALSDLYNNNVVDDNRISSYQNVDLNNMNNSNGNRIRQKNNLNIANRNYYQGNQKQIDGVKALNVGLDNAGNIYIADNGKVKYVQIVSSRSTNGNRKITTATNLAPTPLINNNVKFYSNAFFNPFEPLVAFLGSDQLQLENYNFLFNAERHTIFQLHTIANKKLSSNPAQTAGSNAIAAAGENVLNVVSGFAFGVNSAISTGSPTIKVEEVQLYNADSLRQSNFSPFNPTRILIHGWLGGSHANVFSTLVPAYLKAGNYNVFTVDWGRGAIADYLTASYRVKPVGKILAKFIDFLHMEAGIRYQDMHVTGFSMGAHIAGIAGKFVQYGHLPVIYALDPALPFFNYDKIDERVAITDADYVEVIHTSVGTYGYDRPLGHVDFYINYGSNQPGCFLNECSHFRAYQVFAESLLWKTAFRGQGCDVQLWYDLIKNRRCLMGTGRNLTMGGDPADASILKGRGGVYYVLINASPPFGRG
ncbi:pancreatic triacylglycerol lipase-like [Teleopsis dalmanni]|uniref:pancreatic triacylglycerol lipase-like n=1 Tax=Teleopsis dalmanni TaxID=139649 RepID=UPI0018CDE8A4|nr:pancreatic triacylglycerol lipase-like [Teleopsis dalmanni]